MDQGEISIDTTWRMELKKKTKSIVKASHISTIIRQQKEEGVVFDRKQRWIQLDCSLIIARWLHRFSSQCIVEHVCVRALGK